MKPSPIHSLLLPVALLLGAPAAAQIELVKDILPGSSSGNPIALTELNGKLYFLARPAGQNELWRSDGTEAGTVRVKVLPDGERSLSMTRVSYLLYFTITDGTTAQLWATDGSESETRLLFESEGTFSDLTSWFDQLMFVHNHPTFQQAIMRSNGTEAGTESIGWNPDVPFSNISELTPYHHLLLFVSDFKIGERQVRDLVAYDRTTEWTTPLVGVIPDQRPEHLTLFKDRVYCAAWGPGGQRELWYSIGGALQHFADLAALAPGSRPRKLTAAGNRLFGWADSEQAGGQLFVTDGTSGNTTWVTSDLQGGTFASHGSSLGDNYLFTLNGLDPDTGEAIGGEPWISNGTLEGTKPLRNIHPTGSSGPRDYTPVGSRSFFQASDGAHGLELWSTRLVEEDGVATLVTEMVEDLYPNTASSSPEELLFLDGRIYFSARGRGLGRELYRLDPGAVSVRAGEGWSRDGSEPVRLCVSDLTPGSTAVVQSDPLPDGTVGVLALGSEAEQAYELIPGVATLIDLAAQVHVVSVQTDEIHVEFPVLGRLPGMKAVFQAVVVKPDTLELIMLTNAALVYTERY